MSAVVRATVLMHKVVPGVIKQYHEDTLITILYLCLHFATKLMKMVDQGTHQFLWKIFRVTLY